ncbi:MAG: zinc-ribbon domain-containing protein [Planctomycetia bacterium]|nr:zinc-ribbon domain-containing protein [Planctomycetia bacterium]
MKATCPHCAERFSISAEMVGKKAKCGQCSHVFVIPESTQVPADASTVAPASATQQAWHSLYLAALAVLMLLFRGQQGGMVLSLIFAIAIETAAIWMTVRGLRIAIKLTPATEPLSLARTAFLVNAILIGLLGLSVVLTLYTLISGRGGAGGLGDFKQIFDSVNQVNKMLPQ